jgi:hypothetical protein
MKKLLLASLMLGTIGAYAQTKKVIIEDYTGLHCGWCPEGTVVLEGLRTSNPSTCLPIAIHTGSYEPASSSINAGTIGSTLTTATGVTGYPNGAVDRKKYTGTSIAMGRGSWSAAFSARAALTAIASISFSSKVDKTNNNYECDVNVTFTTAPTSGVPVVVQVYVIEDSIAATGALAQDNYSSSVQGGASPLNPWFHNRTFRKALSGDAYGFSGVIPATPVVGTKYTKHITLAADAAWVKKNVTLVAYVAYNGSAASDQIEILNAEETKLSSFFKTGVNNVEKAVDVLSISPNPVGLNDIAKVEYSINESSAVKMNVYNALGQLVATPMNSSFETAGSHIFQWKASEYALTPGIYIMEVVTAQGKQVERITLQ